MTVKPSLSFLKTNSDPELVVSTGTILTGMTDNPNFLTPSPPLSVVQAGLDDFSTALTNAADGGKTLTRLKNNKRAALALLLREVAAYLVVACKGDLAVLISSGFPHQKPHRQPIGDLPTPKNITISLGKRSGELIATMSPVRGASLYGWRVSTAESPGIVVITTQSTAASNTFKNLIPGVLYKIQANAVGTAGPSDWSNPVLQRVL
jgi:hypothetical protein